MLSGVADCLAAQGVDIRATGHSIVVSTDSALEVGIYGIDGKRLFAGIVVGQTTLPVESGIYIVSVGNRSTKVLVK